MSLGQLSVYKKMDIPMEIEDFAAKIGEGTQQADRNGMIAGVSLSGFLQLIQMECKTCLLEVRGPIDEKGFFCFEKGILLDAMLKDSKGEDAALRMMGWDKVGLAFRNLPKGTKVKKRIQRSLMSLLLTEAKDQDESSARSEAQSSDTEKLSNLEGSGEEREVMPDPQADPDEGPSTEADLPRTAPSHTDHVKPTLQIEGSSAMAGLKPILEDMLGELDGVIAMGIVGMDGITVSEINPSGTDTDAFSAKFAMVMKLVVRSTGDLKNLGNFEENLVQTQNAWTLTRFLNDKYFLGVVVSREGTLGNIRYVVQKYHDQLVRTL